MVPRNNWQPIPEPKLVLGFQSIICILKILFFLLLDSVIKSNRKALFDFLDTFHRLSGTAPLRDLSLPRNKIFLSLADGEKRKSAAVFSPNGFAIPVICFVKAQTLIP